MELHQICNTVNKSNLKRNSPKCLLVNDKTINTPIEIAEAFNNFFASVGPNLASSFPKVSEKNYRKFLKNKVSSSFYLSPPQDTEVFDIIMSLKSKKSCGPDNISNIFIRACRSFHINSYFNIVLRTFTERRYIFQLFKNC